jgi:integrase
MWRARYRDAAGKEHAQHFTSKDDGQKWLDRVTASIVTGTYVDPSAGKTTFREYAENWRAIQAHRESTQDYVERTFRLHLYPTLGHRPLREIRPSEVRAAMKKMESTLGESSIKVAYRYASSVFKSAVLDRFIPVSPCTGLRVPKQRPIRHIPISTTTVQSLADAVPAHLNALIVLAAGTGMRQGEVFGLTVDRVDFLRRKIHVNRQLIKLKGEPPKFGPLKTESSLRTLPMPQVVADALAHHLAHYPPGEHGLVFTNQFGRPLLRSPFDTAFRKAARSAGVSDTVVCHSLRHYYASLLIYAGESVKVVQARLGHASATTTLDDYAHLWPESDERTREAIDDAFRSPPLDLPNERTA